MSIAPYDVRQGNFVGAGVNTVTRSGTNRITGSFYHRTRNEDFVGTEAAGLPFNPGTFTTKNTGFWVGGPFIRNRLFGFSSFEKQDDTPSAVDLRRQPGRRAGPGQHDPGDRLRPEHAERVPLAAASATRPGRYENISKKTPAKPFLIKGDYNLNTSNKVTFRYSQLGSSTDVNLSSSASLGFGRPTFSQQLPQLPELELHDSREHQVGHRRVELDLRVEHVEQPDRRLHQAGREPRRRRHAVPVRRHPRRRGHRLHGLRLRAVHAEQRAALQHLPAPGQLHQVRQEAHPDVRRRGREVPVGERVLPRQAERLRLQLAGRLLHRRQRLPGQPEPHGVADLAAPLPGPLHEHPGPREAAAAARGAATRAATCRTSSGRSRT